MANHVVSIPGKLTAAWRGDGLRAWKANNGGTKEFFLYDGDVRICELNASGSVNHAYGFGPGGLAQRYDPAGGGAYVIYTFDPNGSVVQRISNAGTATVVDTAVYDSFGMLHADLSVNGGSLPVSDPISGLSQLGHFTDEETRTGTPATTGLPQDKDGNYYDPATGRKLSRRGEYHLRLTLEEAGSYAIAGAGEGLGNFVASSAVGLAKVGTFLPNLATGGKAYNQLDKYSRPLVVGSNPIERGFAGYAELSAETVAFAEMGKGLAGLAGEATGATAIGRGFGRRGGAGGGGGEGGGGAGVLPPSSHIDPWKVNFTQRSVSWRFSDPHYNIGDTAFALREGMPDLEPIRVFVRDGEVFSLDNRRLLAYRGAGREIPYQRVDQANMRMSRSLLKRFRAPAGIIPFIKNVDSE